MSKARKIAWSEMKKLLIPTWGGLFIGMAATYSARHGCVLTWKTWLYWGLVFIGIPALIFLISFLHNKHMESKETHD
jgi:hypothetical protein